MSLQRLEERLKQNDPDPTERRMRMLQMGSGGIGAFLEGTNLYYEKPEIVKDTIINYLMALEKTGEIRILDDSNLAIVDIGCWKGLLVKILREGGFPNAIGVECDEEKASAEPDLVKHAYAHEMPFEDDSIGLALANALFSNPEFSRSQPVAAVLNEIGRVLREGGLCIVLDDDDVIPNVRRAVQGQLFEVLTYDRSFDGDLVLKRKAT